MRVSLTMAAVWLALLIPAAAAPLTGDGPGCTDKATAAKFLTLNDTDPEYITIWATGMQDGSCRGFSAGQDVSVDDRADGMACVRTAEDAKCFWVRAEMAK